MGGRGAKTGEGRKENETIARGGEGGAESKNEVTLQPPRLLQKPISSKRIQAARKRKEEKEKREKQRGKRKEEAGGGTMTGGASRVNPEAGAGLTRQQTRIQNVELWGIPRGIENQQGGQPLKDEMMPVRKLSRL